jgi:hypothetical protein
MYDKTYHDFFLFSIWNTCISIWRIEKGCWIIYNNHDKTYHGIVFHFLFEFFNWKIGKGFSNIYNNHVKSIMSFFPFSILNVSIIIWKFGKRFSNIGNNHGKAYHGIFLFISEILIFLFFKKKNIYKYL